MGDDDGAVFGQDATFLRATARLERGTRGAGQTAMPSTREQDVLRDLAWLARRGALVHGGDVEAWLRSEGADSGRLVHEGRKLRRAMPNDGLVSACTVGALVAGVALTLNVANLVGQGRPSIVGILVIVAEAMVLAATAWASVRLQKSRDALRSRLAWVEATERERQRMACEVVEVGDDGILVRTLRDGAATARLIPIGSVTSCETWTEGEKGRHMTFAVVTDDGARTLFKWIPTAGGAADTFERFAKRVQASRARPRR